MDDPRIAELFKDGFVLDEGINIPFFSMVCDRCKHLESGARRTCKAFPGGIPLEIWEEKNDHTKPYPGDQGIRFEARDAQR